MTKNRVTLISRSKFINMVREPTLPSIEGNKRFRNLATRYWKYDVLLPSLNQSGWVRFAPGFKAGLYGHPRSEFCIKVLGMGVGDNPLYFCERGYYLAHERTMLEDFTNAGFDFAPKPLSQEDSIRFLVDYCQLDSQQAEWRVSENDVLIMEFIPGIPFATQTGNYLDYDTEIAQFDIDVLREMLHSLYNLKENLNEANRQKLLHNDPMPPNIIFTISEENKIRARLVDFEIAQNLNKPSPEYVNNSVAELYVQRNVPKNPNTNQYVKNLDQHLIDESIIMLDTIIKNAPQVRESIIQGISIRIPFLGAISVNLNYLLKKSKDVFSWRLSDLDLQKFLKVLKGRHD